MALRGVERGGPALAGRRDYSPSDDCDVKSSESLSELPSSLSYHRALWFLGKHQSLVLQQTHRRLQHL